MSTPRFRYVFGPVRSRRLGRSLGVNNVPYKTCSYSCIYCQLGRTLSPTVERRPFYRADDVVDEVRRFVREFGAEVDCVTFAPDGEPLLDRAIGEEIRRIKAEVSVPVAILTNSSLLYLEEARADLLEADIVSVKIDGLTHESWRAVNRPHPELNLEGILSGLREFAKAFRGRLLTETMLVDNVNANPGELRLIASFIRSLNPLRSYVAVPTRPPAEPSVRPPPPGSVVEAYLIFARELGEGRVELLNMPEPPGYRAYGDPEVWLLNTVSVHPLRLSYAIEALRGLVDDPEGLIERLKKKGDIHLVRYMNDEFVIRGFTRQSPTGVGD